MLTKNEALQICRDLWTWMAEEEHTEHDAKAEWPGWGNRKFLNNCPCCEYASTEDALDCTRCPLKDYWGNNERYACVYSDESPYYPFENGKGRPELAWEIVDYCEKELGYEI